MGKERVHTVYMVRCADGSLYTGWTTRLEERIRAHNAGTGAKYTKSRRPVELVYREVCPTKSEALKRECAIKRLSRKEKLALIREADGTEAKEAGACLETPPKGRGDS